MSLARVRTSFEEGRMSSWIGRGAGHRAGSAAAGGDDGDGATGRGGLRNRCRGQVDWAGATKYKTTMSAWISPAPIDKAVLHAATCARAPFRRPSWSRPIQSRVLDDAKLVKAVLDRPISPRRVARTNLGAPPAASVDFGRADLTGADFSGPS